ncbi:hypothetical protein I5G62_gp34 [Mycobacterium phage CRB2]|uniref:Glycine-rich domain-containing protein n=1 Tax=Mycobacterium phage CRB2 TaxID=2483623 RepID=A0A455LSD9_9CAUD|nr:hypothetical protein I5G62_gp34 [Mycobacterium phage CRB2]AYP70020.1 hypothetical protein CRB2_34 [Mycobacterium phage CRB2]
MPWYPERPSPGQLILPPPGWHPEPAPEEFHVKPPPGWWAVIALDTALTVHWIEEMELEFIKAVGLEVLYLTTDRQLALTKLGMLSLERNIEATTALEMHGVYALGIALSITLQKSLAMLKIAPVTLSQAFNLTPNLVLGNIKTIDVSRALAVTPALAMTPIQMMSLPKALTVTPSLGLGAFLSEAFSQTIAATRGLAFGFPPTAEVTDTYGTTGTTGGQNFTHTVRRWSNFNDLVLMGGGGGGQGSGCCGFNGDGAGAGAWATITIVRGPVTDASGNLAWSVINWPVAIGGGGDGGALGLGAIPGSPGASGGASTMTIAGMGTLSAAGGSAGFLAGNMQGGTATPNPLVLNGQNYAAGVGGAGSSAAGGWPGGGGAGAKGGLFSGNKAGPGGRGRGWVRSYQ